MLFTSTKFYPILQFLSKDALRLVFTLYKKYIVKVPVGPEIHMVNGWCSVKVCVSDGVGSCCDEGRDVLAL